MDSCRVCKSSNKDMTNIFDKDDSIAEKVYFCTGIRFTKGDGLPLHMCKSCLNDLSIAHRFKTLCTLANDSFQKLTEAKVKTEVDNDEDYNNDDDLSVLNPDIVLKEENNSEGNKGFKECTEVKTVLDKRKTECVELSKTTRQKKRGPYKKKAEIKQYEDVEQPKVKKKSPAKKKQDADIESSTKTSQYYLKRLRCEPCGLVFDSRPLADAHRDATHKGEAHWMCEICGQKFGHRGSLSTHIRTHFPPRFACPQCSYRAAHKYDLTKHRRIHAGERPFQCDMCPASFYEASNMNSHIRRNHQKVMNFKCEVCDRGFYDRSKLKRHIDSHNNVKRHECEQCHTAFTRLSYLKTHLRKRHGIELPPLRPGPQRRNLIVDVPPVQYMKPTLITTPLDAAT